MKNSKKLFAAVLLPVVMTQSLFGQTGISGGGFGGSSSTPKPTTPTPSRPSTTSTSGSSSSSASTSTTTTIITEAPKASYSLSRVMSEGEFDGKRAAETVLEKIGRFEGQRYAAVKGVQSSLREILNFKDNKDFKMSKRWSETFANATRLGEKDATAKAAADAKVEAQSHAAKVALEIISARFIKATKDKSQPDNKIPAIQVPNFRITGPTKTVRSINQMMSAADVARIESQLTQPSGINLYDFTMDQSFLQNGDYLGEVRNFYSSNWAFNEWKNRNLNNNTSFYSKISDYSLSENSSSNSSSFREAFRRGYDSRINNLANKMSQSSAENQAARSIGESFGNNIAKTIVKDAGYKEGFERVYPAEYQAEMDMLFEPLFRIQFKKYLEKFETEVIIGSDIQAKINFGSSGGFAAPGVQAQLAITQISNIGKGTAKILPITSSLNGSEMPSISVLEGLKESSELFYVNGMGMVELSTLLENSGNPKSKFLTERKMDVIVRIQDQTLKLSIDLSIESVTGALGTLKPGEAGFNESIYYVSVLLNREWHGGNVFSKAPKFKKGAYSSVDAKETPIYARVINAIRSLPTSQRQQAKKTVIAIAGKVFGAGGDASDTSTAGVLSFLAKKQEKANQQAFIKTIQGL